MQQLIKVHKCLVRKRREHDVGEIQNALNSFENYLHKRIGDARRAGEGSITLNTSLYPKRNKTWITIDLVITNIKTKSRIHMDIYRFKSGVPMHKVAKSISEARWILREFLEKELIKYKIPVPDAIIERERIIRIRF